MPGDVPPLGTTVKTAGDEGEPCGTQVDNQTTTELLENRWLHYAPIAAPMQA
jgi:hypothetical protein